MKIKNHRPQKNLENFFKVISKFDWSDLTANHASILSSDNKSFYINKHKYLFSEIKEKNLIKVDINDEYHKKYKDVNKAGFYIHKYLHNSKAKPGAILHTHSKNGVAISCLKDGFNEKLNQSSMRFYKRIEYIDYEGMVINAKIAKKMSSKVNIKTKVLILKNHGVIILGNDIEELFHLTYHFEKCAEIQLKVSHLKNLNHVKNKFASKTCSQHEGFGKVGHMSWNASLRMIKKK